MAERISATGGGGGGGGGDPYDLGSASAFNSTSSSGSCSSSHTQLTADEVLAQLAQLILPYYYQLEKKRRQRRQDASSSGSSALATSSDALQSVFRLALTPRTLMILKLQKKELALLQAIGDGDSVRGKQLTLLFNVLAKVEHLLVSDDPTPPVREEKKAAAALAAGYVPSVARLLSQVPPPKSPFSLGPSADYGSGLWNSVPPRSEASQHAVTLARGFGMALPLVYVPSQGSSASVSLSTSSSSSTSTSSTKSEEFPSVFEGTATTTTNTRISAASSASVSSTSWPPISISDATPSLNALEMNGGDIAVVEGLAALRPSLISLSLNATPLASLETLLVHCLADREHSDPEAPHITEGKEAGSLDVGFEWPRLRVLNCRGCGLKKLGAALTLAPQLEILDLGKNSLASLAGLEYAPTLRALALDENGLTGARVLQILSQCVPNILALNLRKNSLNGIGDVSGFVNLRRLDLSFNQFVSLSDLWQLQVSVPTLAELDVTGNSFALGEQQLRACIAAIFIERITGSYIYPAQLPRKSWLLCDADPTQLSLSSINSASTDDLALAQPSLATLFGVNQTSQGEDDETSSSQGAKSESGLSADLRGKRLVRGLGDLALSPGAQQPMAVSRLPPEDTMRLKTILGYSFTSSDESVEPLKKIPFIINGARVTKEDINRAIPIAKVLKALLQTSARSLMRRSSPFVDDDVARELERERTFYDHSGPLQPRALFKFSSFRSASTFGCLAVDFERTLLLAATGAKVDTLPTGLGSVSPLAGYTSLAEAASTTNVTDISTATAMARAVASAAHADLTSGWIESSTSNDSITYDPDPTTIVAKAAVEPTIREKGRKPRRKRIVHIADADEDPVDEPLVASSPSQPRPPIPPVRTEKPVKPQAKTVGKTTMQPIPIPTAFSRELTKAPGEKHGDQEPTSARNKPSRAASPSDSPANFPPSMSPSRPKQLAGSPQITHAPWTGASVWRPGSMSRGISSSLPRGSSSIPGLQQSAGLEVSRSSAFNVPFQQVSAALSESDGASAGLSTPRKDTRPETVDSPDVVQTSEAEQMSMQRDANPSIPSGKQHNPDSDPLSLWSLFVGSEPHDAENTQHDLQSEKEHPPATIPFTSVGLPLVSSTNRPFFAGGRKDGMLVDFTKPGIESLAPRNEGDPVEAEELLMLKAYLPSERPIHGQSLPVLPECDTDYKAFRAHIANSMALGPIVPDSRDFMPSSPDLSSDFIPRRVQRLLETLDKPLAGLDDTFRPFYVERELASSTNQGGSVSRSHLTTPPRLRVPCTSTPREVVISAAVARATLAPPMLDAISSHYSQMVSDPIAQKGQFATYMPLDQVLEIPSGISPLAMIRRDLSYSLRGLLADLDAPLVMKYLTMQGDEVPQASPTPGLTSSDYLKLWKSVTYTTEAIAYRHDEMVDENDAAPPSNNQTPSKPWIVSLGVQGMFELDAFTGALRLAQLLQQEVDRPIRCKFPAYCVVSATRSTRIVRVLCTRMESQLMCALSNQPGYLYTSLQQHHRAKALATPMAEDVLRQLLRYLETKPGLETQVNNFFGDRDLVVPNLPPVSPLSLSPISLQALALRERQGFILTYECPSIDQAIELERTLGYLLRRFYLGLLIRDLLHKRLVNESQSGKASAPLLAHVNNNKDDACAWAAAGLRSISPIRMYSQLQSHFSVHEHEPSKWIQRLYDTLYGDFSKEPSVQSQPGFHHLLRGIVPILFWGQEAPWREEFRTFADFPGLNELILGELVRSENEDDLSKSPIYYSAGGSLMNDEYSAVETTDAEPNSVRKSSPAQLPHTMKSKPSMKDIHADTYDDKAEPTPQLVSIRFTTMLPSIIRHFSNHDVQQKSHPQLYVRPALRSTSQLGGLGLSPLFGWPVTISVTGRTAATKPTPTYAITPTSGSSFDRSQAGSSSLTSYAISAGGSLLPQRSKVEVYLTYLPPLRIGTVSVSPLAFERRGWLQLLENTSSAQISVVATPGVPSLVEIHEDYFDYVHSIHYASWIRHLWYQLHVATASGVNGVTNQAIQSTIWNFGGLTKGALCWETPYPNRGEEDSPELLTCLVRIYNCVDDETGRSQVALAIANSIIEDHERSERIASERLEALDMVGTRRDQDRNWWSDATGKEFHRADHSWPQFTKPTGSENVSSTLVPALTSDVFACLALASNQIASLAHASAIVHFDGNVASSGPGLLPAGVLLTAVPAPAFLNADALSPYSTLGPSVALDPINHLDWASENDPAMIQALGRDSSVASSSVFKPEYPITKAKITLSDTTHVNDPFTFFDKTKAWSCLEASSERSAIAKIRQLAEFIDRELQSIPETAPYTSPPTPSGGLDLVLRNRASKQYPAFSFSSHTAVSPQSPLSSSLLSSRGEVQVPSQIAPPTTNPAPHLAETSPSAPVLPTTSLAQLPQLPESAAADFLGIMGRAAPPPGHGSTVLSTGPPSFVKFFVAGGDFPCVLTANSRRIHILARVPAEAYLSFFRPDSAFRLMHEAIGEGATIDHLSNLDERERVRRDKADLHRLYGESYGMQHSSSSDEVSPSLAKHALSRTLYSPWQLVQALPKSQQEFLIPLAEYPLSALKRIVIGFGWGSLRLEFVEPGVPQFVPAATAAASVISTIASDKLPKQGAKPFESNLSESSSPPQTPLRSNSYYSTQTTSEPKTLTLTSSGSHVPHNISQAIGSQPRSSSLSSTGTGSNPLQTEEPSRSDDYVTQLNVASTSAPETFASIPISALVAPASGDDSSVPAFSVRGVPKLKAHTIVTRDRSLTSKLMVLLERLVPTAQVLLSDFNAGLDSTQTSTLRRQMSGGITTPPALLRRTLSAPSPSTLLPSSTSTLVAATLRDPSLLPHLLWTTSSARIPITMTTAQYVGICSATNSGESRTDTLLDTQRFARPSVAAGMKQFTPSSGPLVSLTERGLQTLVRQRSTVGAQEALTEVGVDATPSGVQSAEEDTWVQNRASREILAATASKLAAELTNVALDAAASALVESSQATVILNSSIDELASPNVPGAAATLTFEGVVTSLRSAVFSSSNSTQADVRTKFTKAVSRQASLAAGSAMSSATAAATVKAALAMRLASIAIELNTQSPISSEASLRAKLEQARARISTTLTNLERAAAKAFQSAIVAASTAAAAEAEGDSDVELPIASKPTPAKKKSSNSLGPAAVNSAGEGAPPRSIRYFASVLSDVCDRLPYTPAGHSSSTLSAGTVPTVVSETTRKSRRGAAGLVTSASAFNQQISAKSQHGKLQRSATSVSETTTLLPIPIPNRHAVLGDEGKDNEELSGDDADLESEAATASLVSDSPGGAAMHGGRAAATDIEQEQAESGSVSDDLRPGRQMESLETWVEAYLEAPFNHRFVPRSLVLDESRICLVEEDLAVYDPFDVTTTENMRALGTAQPQWPDYIPEAASDPSTALMKFAPKSGSARAQFKEAVAQLCDSISRTAKKIVEQTKSQHETLVQGMDGRSRFKVTHLEPYSRLIKWFARPVHTPGSIGPATQVLLPAIVQSTKKVLQMYLQQPTLSAQSSTEGASTPSIRTVLSQKSSGAQINDVLTTAALEYAVMQARGRLGSVAAGVAHRWVEGCKLSQNVSGAHSVSSGSTVGAGVTHVTSALTASLSFAPPPDCHDEGVGRHELDTDTLLNSPSPVIDNIDEIRDLLRPSDLVDVSLIFGDKSAFTFANARVWTIRMNSQAARRFLTILISLMSNMSNETGTKNSKPKVSTG